MNKDEKKLLHLYRCLTAEDQFSLLRFGAFLAQNNTEEIAVIDDPQPIEASDNETVIGALKRLSASYFMLDKALLLSETSTLVTQHVTQGRAKEAVIEELEMLFKTHYEKLKEK